MISVKVKPLFMASFLGLLVLGLGVWGYFILFPKSPETQPSLSAARQGKEPGVSETATKPKTEAVEVLTPVRGKVKEISNQAVTVETEKGTKTYSLSSTTKVYKILSPSEVKPGEKASQDLSLGDVKTGDNVEVRFDPSSPEDQIVGTLVVLGF